MKSRRIRYARKMAWAIFWTKMLGIYQFFDIPSYPFNPVYGWMLEQVGFAYAGDYSEMKHLDNW